MRKLQTKSTPARSAASTAHDAVTVAHDACLEKLRRVTVDARNFHFQLTHSPKGPSVEVLWSEYPKRNTQWLRDICDAVRGYVTRLHEHHPDVVWVKREVEKNWKGLEEEREKWTGIIGEILRHAGTVGSVEKEEIDCAIRVAEAEHYREFEAAKRVALRAPGSSSQKRAASPDPVKQRMGELMQQHPGWSNSKIIGKYVGEGDGTPPERWRKHNHREGDMLDAFACPDCKHAMQSFLSRLRHKLGLPARR